MQTVSKKASLGFSFCLYTLGITQRRVGHNSRFPLLLTPQSIFHRVRKTYGGQIPSSSYCHYRVSYQEYWARGFILEPQEEEAARIIKVTISSVQGGTVDDVVLSLSHSDSCSTTRLTCNLVDSLLRRFGDDWKYALGLFSWASSQMGYSHTSHAFNRMVDILGKMRQFDHMWKLVDEMRAKGLLTLETIAKVMRRLAGARRWRDAISVFDDLGSMGVDKDTRSMNILLDTLCKENQIDVAREVFLELKACIAPDAYTFNIFVHGWSAIGRIDEARWTILEMKGYGIKPSVITYSTIIQAYCYSCDFRKVHEIFDEMLADGCPPNIVTYTTAMRALAKSQGIEEAMGIVSRMESSGCKPDTLFYNSLIDIMGRSGMLQKAFQIFKEEMQTNCVMRSVATYNCMISMFCLHRQEENALLTLKEMEDSSCKPDLLTYTPLLKLYIKIGKTDDQIRCLLDNMVNRHHLSLDISTYTLLIHGLCKEGNFEWAYFMFNEMLSHDMLPRIQTCKLLVNVAEERNMDEAVERVRSLMNQSHKLIP